MSDYTPAEVDEALENAQGPYGFGLSWTELLYEDYDNKTLSLRGTDVPFEVVESNDGGDAVWEYEVYVVIKVGDQYFKREGMYYSHVGVEFDSNTHEVVEGEKTVKVWKDV